MEEKEEAGDSRSNGRGHTERERERERERGQHFPSTDAERTSAAKINFEVTDRE